MLHFTTGSPTNSSKRPFHSDRWVIGDAVDSKNEYIFHLTEPRFAAKFYIDVYDEDPPQISSRMYVYDDYIFYDFIWFDGEPHEDIQTALLDEAGEALDRYGVDDEYYGNDDY